MKTNRNRIHSAKYKGFTLVEMVAVIVILAIVSIGVTNFIGSSTQMYVDTAARDEVIARSRFAVERLNRDLRYALPNSIRIEAYRQGVGFEYSAHCIEYFPIEWSTFYTSLATGTGSSSDTISGPEMISATSSTAGYDSANSNLHYVVVYPLSGDEVYVENLRNNADSGGIPYSATNPREGKIVPISSVGAVDGDGLRTVNFQHPMRFEAESTAERFYIVSDPISYCVIREGDSYNLYRLSNYGINAVQTANVNAMATVVGASKVLMAQGLTNAIGGISSMDLDNTSGALFDEAPFRIEDTNLRRNSIVHTFLAFELNGAKVTFNNEIHLRNSP